MPTGAILRLAFSTDASNAGDVHPARSSPAVKSRDGFHGGLGRHDIIDNDHMGEHASRLCNCERVLEIAATFAGPQSALGEGCANATAVMEVDCQPAARRQCACDQHTLVEAALTKPACVQWHRDQHGGRCSVFPGFREARGAKLRQRTTCCEICLKLECGHKFAHWKFVAKGAEAAVESRWSQQAAFAEFLPGAGFWQFNRAAPARALRQWQRAHAVRAYAAGGLRSCATEQAFEERHDELQKPSQIARRIQYRHGARVVAPVG